MPDLVAIAAAAGRAFIVREIIVRCLHTLGSTPPVRRASGFPLCGSLPYQCIVLKPVSLQSSYVVLLPFSICWADVYSGVVELCMVARLSD